MTLPANAGDPPREAHSLLSWGNMHGFRLTSRQRRRLRAKLKYVKGAREAKRILALLALDRGTPLAQVAAEIGVTRQTVYNWIERFDEDDNPDGLRDRAGRGRLPALSKPTRQFLEWSLDPPPDALGYPLLTRGLDKTFSPSFNQIH